MEIKLTHLYPDILNLSADKGNILAIKERCKKRDISFCATKCNLCDEIDFDNTDILLIGGGCEKDKITVNDNLFKIKDKIVEYINDGGLILVFASSYPVIGKSFEVEGEIHQGLDLINMTTVYDRKRKTGNVILRSDVLSHTIVGFENHCDKTIYEDDVQCLGEIIYGSNIGQREGVITDNIIGTHLHGPILPKNTHLTDYIIKNALKKEGVMTPLSEIDSSYEEKAHNYILERFKI